MAERVETIRLTANIANYITGMQQAQKATLATASASSKLAAQGAAMTNLGHTLLLFGTAVAAGVTLAVKTFADFDAQMAQVKTLSHATADEMDQLSKAAETLGQKIGISASQAADAELELVKAGVSVSDILGGALQGSLQLAAAGQIDVGKATEIATIALTQFKLTGADVPHVADLLAAGADKALGGVQDLGEALKSGGLVASQFGISLDETVGTLSAFANAGLLGETAGTDLRQVLLKLANPSTEAAALMQKYGISLYDAAGKTVSLSTLSGELTSGLGTLSDAQKNNALATIFGSRAINGANVLMKEGAAGITDWTNKVNASGFAAHQAAGKMDNLNGDLSKLGAAFQANLITSGSAANDTLREMVQLLTGLVHAFGNLPAPVQGAVLATGAIVAVMALAAGAFLTIVPKIVATRDAMSALGITMKGTVTTAGAVGGALAALTIVVGYFAQRQADADAATASLQDTLDASTGAITKSTRAYVAQQLAQSGAFKAAKEAGVSQKELTDAILQGGDAFTAVKQKLIDNNTPITFFSGVGIRAGMATDEINKLNDGIVQGRQNLKDQAAAADGSASSTDTATSAYSAAASAAKDLNNQISDLIDTINTANGVGQDAVSANASYQKALADAGDYADKARKHVKGYALGVNEATAAGSANVAMLADLAKKNEDAAKAQFALDGNTDNYVATLKAGRQAVIDHARALGATAAQAQDIADKVAAIPSQAEIQILVDTQQATQSIADLEKKFGTLNAAAAASAARYAGQAAAYSKLPKHASGGFTSAGAHIAVVGEQGSEFVLTHSAITKPANVAAAQYMNAGGTIPEFAGGGFTSAPSRDTSWGVAHRASGPSVPVNIQVTGETDPQVFAAMAGNAVAVRVRGVLR